MKGRIYKVTNKVNGKVYIGQTRYTTEFRWRQHKNKKDNTHFHQAIQKYGEDSFIVETLEECEIDKLDSREIFYIAKYDSFNSGYNSTYGGTAEKGRSKIISDNKYDEIAGLYLSGFSSNKIADLYQVDKATILKILHAMGIKLRSNSLNINKQEFEELVADYQSGWSLKQLAKRYDCTGPALGEYLKRKGIDLRQKFSILEDKEKQAELIKEYTSSTMHLSEIQKKYHCEYATLMKVLSINGVSKGKYSFKMTPEQCLEAIKKFNEGMKVSSIAKEFEVDKTTIYSMLKRYGINYKTV